MLRNLTCAAIFLVSTSALAVPKLVDLQNQKRCTPAIDKPEAFDCMVDQADGSVKKVRYFRAKTPAAKKTRSE